MDFETFVPLVALIVMLGILAFVVAGGRTDDRLGGRSMNRSNDRDERRSEGDRSAK